MVFTTEGFFAVVIESWPEWDCSHHHWDLFRRSNRLSYQAMSSTCTYRKLCTTTPISSFVQCQIIFWLLPWSVATLKYKHIILKPHVLLVITKIAFWHMVHLGISMCKPYMAVPKWTTCHKTIIVMTVRTSSVMKMSICHAISDLFDFKPSAWFLGPHIFWYTYIYIYIGTQGKCT